MQIFPPPHKNLSTGKSSGAAVIASPRDILCFFFLFSFSFFTKVVFEIRQNFQSNIKFYREHHTVSSFLNFCFVKEIQNKKISNMSRVNAKTNGPIESKFCENVAPTLGQDIAGLNI